MSVVGEQRGRTLERQRIKYIKVMSRNIECEHSHTHTHTLHYLPCPPRTDGIANTNTLPTARSTL